MIHMRCKTQALSTASASTLVLEMCDSALTDLFGAPMTVLVRHLFQGNSTKGHNDPAS